MDEQTERVAFRCPTELVKALDEIALQKGWRRSRTLRWMVWRMILSEAEARKAGSRRPEEIRVKRKETV